MKFPAGFVLGLLLCSVSSADEIDLCFNRDAVRPGYIHALEKSDLQADFDNESKAEFDNGANIGFNIRFSTGV
jgi:hypothetical protein